MTNIYEAVKNEDVNALQRMISEKRNLNRPDKDGFTPLMVAAGGKNSEIVTMLIDNGADVDAKDKYGNTALIFALCWGKNPDVVRAFIDGGADVNARNEKGKTPLTIAKECHNKPEIIKMLTDVGAEGADGGEEYFEEEEEKSEDEEDGDVRDEGENTDVDFLMRAVRDGKSDIVAGIIDAGMDVNARDNDGNTALIIAVASQHPEIVGLLIEKGADVNAKDNDGWTALTRAQEQNWILNDEKKETVDLLLNAGINKIRENKEPNGGKGKKEKQQQTVWLALEKNKVDAAKLLIEEGDDINAVNGGKRTPLWYALENNDINFGKWLIEKGADVNVRAVCGQKLKPLLWRAAELNNVDFAILLVDGGAEIDEKEIGGDFIKKLKSRNVFKLTSLIKNGLSLKQIQSLINGNANVKIRDENKKTPLMLAVEKNSVEIAEWLIKNKADVNTPDKNGKTPLLCAVKGGNFELVKLLVDNRADIYAADDTGESPLSYAVKNNSAELVRLITGGKALSCAVESGDIGITKRLIEAGADVNEDNVLKIAAVNNNVEMAKLLIDAGADVNARDGHGETALMKAAEKGNLEIVRLLIEKGAENDRSVLLSAVKGNHVETVKWLIENGAEANDAELLRIAAVNDNVETAKLLIENGADVRKTDRNGNRPKYYAVSSEMKELLTCRDASDFVSWIAIVLIAAGGFFYYNRGYDGHAKPTRAVYTAAATLNCRSLPGTDGKIVGKVKNGEKLSCSEFKGEWCKTVCGGKDAFVYKKHLVETPDEKKR